MGISPGPRDSSCCRAKRVASFSSRMGGGSLNGEENELLSPRPISISGTKREAVRSEIKKMGPICKNKKRVAPPFTRSSTDEEIDFDKQLRKGEFFGDKEDSLWLSSNSYSPSSFFQDYRLSSSLHVAVDDWLISWLSTLASSYLNINKATALTEVGELNPEHRERSPKSQQIKSPRNDEIDHQSSSGQITEESASCLTPSTFSSSEVAGFDGARLLVSLVDLDREDTEWISEAQVDLNYFQSGFPSPSCRSIWSSHGAASSSSCNVSTTASEGKREDSYQSSNSPTSTASPLEDLDGDEPIFWPFERKLEWSSDKTWRLFSMSPRRDTNAIQPGTSRNTPAKPRPALSKFQEAKSDARESCRRRLVLDSNSAASGILQSRERKKNSGVKRADPTSSMLGKSTKFTAKMVPKEVKDKRVEATVGKFQETKLGYTDGGIILEDDFAPNGGELPIEALLGLGEFDGHEGVDSDCNCDIFDLDQSL